jgi:hypothetical protein
MNRDVLDGAISSGTRAAASNRIIKIFASIATTFGSKQPNSDSGTVYLSLQKTVIGSTALARYGYCGVCWLRSFITREADCGAEFIAQVTISGNTNNNAATNGQSLHTRRHWFAAKNPSRRSRTRSWTRHDTPPKEAAARRVIHKKMQIRALWSRRAEALTYRHWPSEIYSWRGLGRPQLLQQRLRLFQIARVEAFRKPSVHRSEQFAGLLRLTLITPEACEARGGAAASETIQIISA